MSVLCEWREEESDESPENQQQQLTIFYNGRVCVCDVTELQVIKTLVFNSSLFGFINTLELFETLENYSRIRIEWTFDHGFKF